MNRPDQLATGTGSKTCAISLGVPLWAMTLLSLGYLCWLFIKAIGAIFAMGLAGWFGADPDLSAHIRTDSLLLGLAATAVSAAACGLAYCFPAMRALPGSHQFAVLGALSSVAPLAAAVWVATR
ncbi:hypothetical protein [Streptomyces sp. 3N207]|uniref:hypothetical protein n=1 Tax=Streptomyces sp. 3N207 TaxID=3457417 RepID=UPI003FD66D20